MLRLPTVSSLQRAMACTASVALEQLDDTPPSASAKRGSLIGAVIASELRGWPKPDVGRHRLKIDMAALRAYLGEGEIRCEAAMSLRPTGEVEYLGENIGREYNRPGCINGAADIVVMRRNMFVVDVKTGTFPVPDPVDNWQLGSLASMLAAFLADDIDSVTGVIAKLGRDGSWDFGKPHTWSLADLAVIREKLTRSIPRWNDAQLMSEAGFAEPEHAQGPHCFFCKARCEHNRNAVKEAA